MSQTYILNQTPPDKKIPQVAACKLHHVSPHIKKNYTRLVDEYASWIEQLMTEQV